MPRLSPIVQTPSKIEFVLSVPLDLMNSMYFTSLAGRAEGIDGWPEQARKQMPPDLLQELDALYTIPGDHLGLMGEFGDHLWAHPEAWKDVDALLDYLHGLDPGMGDPPLSPGIQGLFYEAFRFEFGPVVESDGTSPHDVMRATLEAEGIDAASMLALFDAPEELRARMVRLVQRFYEEVYEPDMPRRMPLLERSYGAHRRDAQGDPADLAKRLSGRDVTCIGTVCTGPYETLYFAPSLDMGPYVSCSDLGEVHGLFYPCEEVDVQEAADAVRLARVYKALGDEQRLRILQMLQGREMFVQEIVERTGLHQSVVSRHLSFMTAVGLITKRREGNTKYVSINPHIREELSRTLDMLAPPAKVES